MANATGDRHLGDPVRVSPEVVLQLSNGPTYLPVRDDAAREMSRPTRWDWSDGRVSGLRLAVGVEPDTATVFVEKAWGSPLRATVRARQGDVAHAADLSLRAGEATDQVGLPSLHFRMPVSIELERDGLMIARGRALPWEQLDGFDRAAFRIQMKSDGRPPPRHAVSAASLLVDGLSPSRPIPALRLSVTVETAFAYFPVQPVDGAVAAIAGRPVALGFWARRRGDDCSVTCRIEDRSGEVFQAPSNVVPGGDTCAWVQLDLFSPDGRYWGGDKNGQPDPPLKWQAMFLIDRKHGQPCAAEIDIARPALAYE